MTRKWIGVLITLFSLTALMTPVMAQDATPEATGDAGQAAMLPPPPADALATGLNFPRGLSFGPDGTLYVATAGVGGTIKASGPEGDTTLGMSAEILAISPDGKVSTVVGSLPSGGNVGVQGVFATADGLVAAVGAGGPFPKMPLIGAGIWIDQSGHITNMTDLFGYEVANNPAGGDEINSDPADVAVAADGTVYFVDAGGNDVLKWTKDGGLSTFITWPDNPVPTSISIGPDGNLAIGFLSPGPFTPGSAKVETYSPDGKLLTTYSGLTMVTGVLWNEDGIYAVEMSQNVAAAQPAPGAVVKVGEEGNNTVVVDNLFLPYGIAQSPSGQVVVSIGAAEIPPGNGAIIPVKLK